MSDAAEVADARLQTRWPTLQPVHTPLHASWLNQIEIYFSIVQRKVLTPNDFATLAAMEHYLRAFEHRYQAMAQPFQWTFTRADKQRLLAKLTAVRPLPSGCYLRTRSAFARTSPPADPT